MHLYTTKTWKSAPVVPVSAENSWTPEHLPDSIKQAIFKKMQLQKKEEKLLRLYDHQQQLNINRIGKTKSGSISSIGSSTARTSTLFTSTRGGKVRQMFDERRLKAGIDRSYPLEPLSQENNPNLVSSAPYKSKVRTNTSTQKNSEITTKLTYPRNEEKTTNKSISRQTVQQNRPYHTNNIDSNNGKIIDYKAHENFNLEDYMFHKDQQNPTDGINRFYIEDDINDKAMLTHIDRLVDKTVYKGVGGKLANLGGKLPSEIQPKNTKPTINTSKHDILNGANGLNISNTIRKGIHESKAAPFIKKTTTVKPPTLIGKLYSPPTSLSGLSSTSSMNRPQSRSNPPSSARSAPLRSANTAGTASTERTPNTQRPSSKQTPRGPSAVQRDDLDECRYCHRRFAGDRLQTHEDICARTGKKKRKTYDATKHRLEGTELAQFAVKPTKSNNTKLKSTASSKSNNWRQKHEEFIASIRSAKVAQQHVAKGGKLSDLPPPPPSTNPDYVQCPHCGRRFNEAAAERHIPKCANFDFNKSKSNKGKTR